MKVTLRPVVSSDTNFARKVHHEAYRDVVTRQFGTWDEQMQDEFFDHMWARGGFEIILRDGQPCGFLAVDDRNFELWVRELVLFPKYQNKGIGSQLLRSLINKARSRNIQLGLRVLRENRAVELYQRFGFKVTRENGPHLEMQMNPNPPE